MPAPLPPVVTTSVGQPIGASSHHHAAVHHHSPPATHARATLAAHPKPGTAVAPDCSSAWEEAELRFEEWLEATRETAASGVEAAGLYRTVGIPVVEGLRSFHRGAYADTVELLLPVRVDLWQIGGSDAHRDIVDWTLTEAAVRTGQRDVALSLAHERLGPRPRSAPNRRFLRNAEAIAA